MFTLLRYCCLCFLLTAQALAADLPFGVTGNFYNPAQSGHGVNVEVLDAKRAIVHWHVYDHAGNPLWLYAEGRIEGNRIRGTAYAPRGMRFGVFDRAELQVPAWGEIELEFSSCARGILRWSSPLGYGTGEIGLQRLAYAASCPGEQRLPAGAMRGFAAPPVSAAGKLDGLVMPDGALWAISPTDLPGMYRTISRQTRIIAAPPAASGTPDRIVAKAVSLPNGFLCRFPVASCDLPAAAPLDLPFVPGGEGMQARLPDDGSQLRIELGYPLAGFDALRGTFYFDADEIHPGRWQIVFEQAGSLCLRAAGTGDCLYAGRYFRDGDGPYEFELQGAAEEPAFRGVIDVDFQEIFLGPIALHFIGSNGITGLAFSARYDYRT